nr:hypothetical protein [Pseudomonas gingeri]
MVDGKFVDENPVSGAPGSLIPAEWGNAVTEEILGVIRAAGLSPSESDFGQLLKATQKIIIDAVRLEPVPFSALAFPTVATSDGRLAITAQSSGSGGRVSIPAGVLISLSEEVNVGLTGRARSIYTSAWSSSELDVNSTYYVRIQVGGNSLYYYVQKGSDTDEIPVSMKGAANALSGGGFDSTCVDVLVAKVVTAAVGSPPLVTLLSNKSRLEVVGVWSGGAGSYSLTLNWARKPRAYIAGIADFDSNVKTDYSIYAEDIGLYAGGVKLTPAGGFSDRYTARVLITAWAQNAGVSGSINARVRWEA